LPRDAKHSAAYVTVSVVRPSVTFVYSIETITQIIKSMSLFDVKCLKTVQEKDRVTMEYYMCDLLKGAIYAD